MIADKTGRPTFTIVIVAPDGRTKDFTGNIWEILLQEANATACGFTTRPKETTAI
jgi:hypothetical protein